MTGSLSPLCTPTAEMNILEINEKLRFQLEKSRQQFRDLKEKFLISEATAYALANQLWKYKCGDYKVIESVLGEKLQPQEGELAEKLTLTEKLRESNILIQEQSQKLSQLRQKLQQGREVSFLLSQHLKDLLTQDNSGDDQAQSLGEQLAEGHWLAYRLVLKLSTENHEDEESEKEWKWMPPRLSREQQEARLKETFENSLGEGLKTSFSHHDLLDTHHPASITAVLLDEHEVSSLDAAENQDDQKQEGEPETLLFSRKLQEDGTMTAEQQGSLNEMYLAHSSCHRFSEFHQSVSIPASLSEKPMVGAILDISENENGCKAGEGQETKAPSRELQEDRTITPGLQDSLDEVYLAHSGYHDLSELHQSPNSPASPPEEHMVCSILDMSENKNDCKIGEGQEAKAPRKCCTVVHDQARELTQLRQQLREGRESSFSLSQHLKDLLIQEDPDSHLGQGHQEQLAQGCKVAEHLVCTLSTENHENEEEEEEKEPLSKMSDQDREFNFLIEVQARELIQLRQKLQKGREASFFLSQHLNDLFTQDVFDSHQGQSHQELLAEGCRLAEYLAHRLDPENHNDQDDDEEESLDSSLNSQPEVEKANELFTDSSAEQYFSPPAHPDASDSQELLRGPAIPLDGPKVSPALDRAKVNVNASFEMKNSTKQDGDAPKGSVDNTDGFQYGLTDATNVLKEKIIKRKVLFSQERIACRFPYPAYIDTKCCWN